MLGDSSKSLWRAANITTAARRGQVRRLTVSKAHLILCMKTKPWFITRGFRDLGMGGELGPLISLTHTMLIKYACDTKAEQAS